MNRAQQERHFKSEPRVRVGAHYRPMVVLSVRVEEVRLTVRAGTGFENRLILRFALCVRVFLGLGYSLTAD